MGFYDIAKNLLEFAQSLFGLGGAIAKHRREERERLAMYLDKIAAVVDSIRQSIEKGERPDADCAELDEYVRTLTQVLASELPDEAARFAAVLSAGALARGVLFIVEDAGSREAAYRDLSGAAGSFRALANRLRL